MKETSKMGRRMEKVPLNGPMGTSILDHGRMVNNMELAFGAAQMMKQRDKVSG